MPSFVPPESARFSLEEGKAVVRAGGVRIERTSEWSLLIQPTLVVIDGPEDEGFLFARIDQTGADHAPSGWVEAVRARGGAWLVDDEGTSVFASVISSPDS